MPPAEVTVNCVGCGRPSRLPLAAVRRNCSYCSACGKQLDMAAVSMGAPAEEGAVAAKPKRRAYRPTRRR
jgi:hypothetical protein